jgi:hypothetical protein
MVRNFYLLCNFNLLKILPLCLPKLKVYFLITRSLHAIKFIAFWGVAPYNLLDYLSIVVEYVT